MLHHRSIWLGVALSLGLSGCSFFQTGIKYTDRPSLNAYLSLPAEDTVAVVSLTDKTSAGSIKVGDNPVNLAINSRANLEYLYSANYNDGTVSFVNLRSGTLEQPVQSGAQPWGIDVTPYMKIAGTETLRQWIVVANTGDGTVSYIDPTSRAMSTKKVAGFKPHGVVASPKSLETFILSDQVTGTGCQVLRINPDGTTGQPTTITGSVQLWKGAITPDGTTLYITDKGATTLYKVDISNGNFALQQPIPLSGAGYDIAIAPNGKTAFVSIPEGTSSDAQGVVDVIDLSSGSKTGSKPVNQRVTEANRPQALAVNAASSELWVTLQNRLGYYGLNTTSGDMEDDLRITPYTKTPGQAPPISDIVLGAGIQ